MKCGGFTNDYISTVDRIVKNPVVTLFYKDLPTLKYRQSKGLVNFNCHIGQRKLLLNEIQFLSYYLKPNKRNYILYVGAAPCEHLTVIDKLFPGNSYLLIDPNFIIADIEYQYIYQNKSVISDSSFKIVKSYAKSSQPHQQRGAARLKTAEFIDGTEFDALQLTDDVWRDFSHKKHKSGSANVFVIQDYMSIALAKKIKDSIPEDVLFISDLRTNLFADGPTPIYSLTIA